MTWLSPARTAFVLGGTGNMGAAIVQMLRREDLEVAFSGRDVASGRALAKQKSATILAADVINRAELDDCLLKAVETLGRIDLFVSAVGCVFAEPLSRTPEPVFLEMLEINLTSVFRCSRFMFRHFKENSGGRMVHIVSDAALWSIHHLPVYTAAKAGLQVMSELFAAEGAPHGIVVNAICPGATTPGVQATIAGFEKHAEDCTTWRAAPSGRHAVAVDIASTVRWLASGDCPHVSGATIRVDGAASAAVRGTTHA